MCPTDVCAQVRCNNPTTIFEALESIDDRRNSGADNGNFEIDQEEAEAESVFVAMLFSIRHRHRTRSARYRIRDCEVSYRLDSARIDEPESDDMEPPSCDVAEALTRLCFSITALNQQAGLHLYVLRSILSLQILDTIKGMQG